MAALTHPRPPYATLSIAAYACFTGASALFFTYLSPQALAQSLPIQPFSTAPDGTPPAPWHVLRVRADRSYANLSHKLARTNRAYTLRWRWRLDQTLAGADLRTKNGDDTPVKVCALYDLPLEKLGFVDRNILRMARTASGEYLPGATLCYVWDQKLPVGADADNTAESSLAYVGDVSLMEQ